VELASVGGFMFNDRRISGRNHALDGVNASRVDSSPLIALVRSDSAGGETTRYSPREKPRTRLHNYTAHNFCLDLFTFFCVCLSLDVSYGPKHFQSREPMTHRNRNQIDSSIRRCRHGADMSNVLVPHCSLTLTLTGLYTLAHCGVSPS
jgi:hypothetical protein